MIDYGSIYKDFKEGRIHHFYTLMYPGLLRYAATILGDTLAFMAEDCVQDAVIGTYAVRQRFGNERHWRSYLISSVHNRAIMILRHHDVESAFREMRGNDGDDIEKDVSHELIRQETLDSLYAAIDSLPEIYRKVFDLSFEHGLKNPEIARLLDVAEITVKKRKDRKSVV